MNHDSPLQPRTESPVLTYIDKDYEEDFKLPQPLLEQPFKPSHDWDFPHKDCVVSSTNTSPFLSAMDTISKQQPTPDKKKRDPYSLVISKLVYLTLQHINEQVTFGLSSYKDLNVIFAQRNTIIPILTRQFCTLKNFQLSLHYVCNYSNLTSLLDENGLKMLYTMQLDRLFAEYLNDDQVILRKFYTHVDLSLKKEFDKSNDLIHISRVWSNLSRKKRSKQ